jgi:hypothetical protein
LYGIDTVLSSIRAVIEDVVSEALDKQPTLMVDNGDVVGYVFALNELIEYSIHAFIEYLRQLQLLSKAHLLSNFG